MPIQMTRQEYEQKYGGAVPEPRPEVAQTLQDMPFMGGQPKSSPLQDLGNDITSAFSNVASGFKSRSEAIGQRQAQGQNPFSSGLQHVGNVAATGVGSIVEAGKLAVKSFLTQDQEDAITKKTSSVMGTLKQNTQTNPTTAPIADEVKGIVSKWNEFKVDNPEAAANIEAGGNIADVLLFFTGGSASKNVAREAYDVAGDVIKNTATKVDDLYALRQATKVEQQTTLATDATKRILQDKTQLMGQRDRNLSGSVDALTKQIKTPDGRTIEWDLKNVGNDYTVLNERGRSTLSDLVKEQDNYLAKFDTRFTSSQLGRFQDVNGQAVISTPVQDALEQMSSYYKSTSNPAKAEQIKQWTAKMEGEGLNVKELNDIARQHAKDLNSFNTQNQLASGLNKQSWEATRAGVKDVLRQRLPDNYSKELDDYYSKVSTTLDKTQAVERSVDIIVQKLDNPTLAKRLQNAVFEMIDLATVRSLTGLADRVNLRRGATPTKNALQIEQELESNLLQLQRLKDIKDGKTLSDQIKEYINNIQIGLSTKDVSKASGNARFDELTDFITQQTKTLDKLRADGMSTDSATYKRVAQSITDAIKRRNQLP